MTNSPYLRYRRILITWIIETVSIGILAYFGFGLTITNIRAAFVAIAVIALLNALVRPALVSLTLPITAITMGLFSLVINAFILVIASRLLPGLEIASFGWAIAISIGLAILNSVFSYLLHINDDDSYYYGVIKKAGRRSQDAVKTDTPGFFYLEVDGLGYQVLKKALDQNLLPNLQAYLKDKNCRVIPWETDLSPQTPACQAGILHGNNSNMPAFRWYDRKQGKLVTGSNPQDAAAIEKERSDGQGLLAGGGVCINNIFSGDAQAGVLTISKLRQKRDRRFHPLYFYFVNPYNYAHTLASVVKEMYREWRDARYAKAHDVKPAISHRGLEFMLMRSVMNVYLADIATQVAIGQILSGKPTIYLTNAGYDDVAHHTGIQSPESLYALSRLDMYIGYLLKAIKDAPRPYHFIILSDHGQADGSNFQTVYGYTLGDLVNRNLAENTSFAAVEDHDETYANTNKLLTEVSQQFRPQHSALVSVGKEQKELQQLTGSGKTGKLPAVLVMASGNLGLINFTDTQKRLTLEVLVKRHPKLIPALLNHPGISFIMVKTSAKGTAVMGKSGTYYLKTGQVEGKNPLAQFSPTAVSHLKRHDTFTHMPDILINSYYNKNTQEVYAFEDFVGSHGGLGGPQNQPFLVFPHSLKPPKQDLIGCRSVYLLLKSWQSVKS